MFQNRLIFSMNLLTFIEYEACWQDDKNGFLKTL
jgi:hypothetical protein